MLLRNGSGRPRKITEAKAKNGQNGTQATSKDLQGHLPAHGVTVRCSTIQRTAGWESDAGEAFSARPQTGSSEVCKTTFEQAWFILKQRAASLR